MVKIPISTKKYYKEVATDIANMLIKRNIKATAGAIAKELKIMIDVEGIKDMND